ncbi:unnamed protein product [Blepharisma stoltei]|uniref:Uncharacterized protein n=1 Tax=Blepharisma stoltei TaxID=1481888 RepID=A0AAU9IEJ0_9CILI|nr:unnamed protein product [Blepharisma stoltei]
MPRASLNLDWIVFSVGRNSSDFKDLRTHDKLSKLRLSNFNPIKFLEPNLPNCFLDKNMISKLLASSKILWHFSALKPYFIEKSVINSSSSTITCPFSAKVFNISIKKSWICFWPHFGMKACCLLQTPIDTFNFSVFILSNSESWRSNWFAIL